MEKKKDGGRLKGEDIICWWKKERRKTASGVFGVEHFDKNNTKKMYLYFIISIFALS